MTSTWIETSAELEALLSVHRGHEQVAVDTEFRRRDTFYPQVALLQLCWGGAAYLIDPLQLDELDALRIPLKLNVFTAPARILRCSSTGCRSCPRRCLIPSERRHYWVWVVAWGIALLWRSFLKWISPRKRRSQTGCSAR